jgi:hypothetical protein
MGLALGEPHVECTLKVVGKLAKDLTDLVEALFI